jgi:hypothetical protein
LSKHKIISTEKTLFQQTNKSKQRIILHEDEPLHDDLSHSFWHWHASAQAHPTRFVASSTKTKNEMKKQKNVNNFSSKIIIENRFKIKFFD